MRMQRLDNEAKERGKRICAMGHHLEALHRRIVDRKHRLRALCAGIEVGPSQTASLHRGKLPRPRRCASVFILLSNAGTACAFDAQALR